MPRICWAAFLLACLPTIAAAEGPCAPPVEGPGGCERCGEPCRRTQIVLAARMEGVPVDVAEAVLILPVPVDLDTQEIRDLEVRAVGSCEHREDPAQGTKDVRIAFAGAQLQSPPSAELSFVLHRRQVRMQLAFLEGQPDAKVNLNEVAAFLEPGDGEDQAARALAEEIAEGKTGSAARARALFDWVVRELKPGDDPGGARETLARKGGDSAGLNAAFVALARAMRIPARLEDGYRLPAGEGRAEERRAWASFFVPNLGWVYLDAFEAARRPTDAARWFGALDRDRITLAIGPVSVRAEVDGRPHTGVSWELRFRDLPGGGE